MLRHLASDAHERTNEIHLAMTPKSRSVRSFPGSKRGRHAPKRVPFENRRGPKGTTSNC